MKDLIRKSFALQLKDVDEAKLEKGELSVVFATMGVWDKDGDWTEPGFFGKQSFQFIPAHKWDHVWMGKGVTREEGNLAIADILVNTRIPSAKDWLEAIKFDLKHGEPLGQYSYGFKILEGGQMAGERLGRNGRILKPREDGTPGSKIWEVSPVLVGAGEGTRTLAAKGMRFSEEIEVALAAVSDLVERGKSLADLRAADGRGMSAASKEALAALAEALKKGAEDITGLIAPKVDPAKEADPELRKELLRMLAIRAGFKPKEVSK